MFSALMQVALFQSLDLNELQALMRCMNPTIRQFGRGDYLFHAGDPAGSLTILLEGSVHVLHEDYWGNRTIVARLAAGELFGEAFSYAQVEHIPVSVQAAEPTHAAYFDIQRLGTTCSNACPHHSRIIHNLLHALAEKAVMLTEKNEIISQRTTREKVMAYLSAYAHEQQTEDFTIPFSRQELAEYLAVDRSNLSRELSRMQQEGILLYTGNTFHLVRKTSSG